MQNFRVGKELIQNFFYFSLFAQIQSNVDSLQREIRTMKMAVKAYVKHFRVSFIKLT